MGMGLEFGRAREIFLKDLRARDYSKATLASYLYSLKTLEAFLRRAQDSVLSKRGKTPKNVTPADWQDYLEEIQKRTLAPSTKGLLITKARIFFSFLTQNHLLLFDPAEGWPKPRSHEPRPLPSILSLREIGRMLECSLPHPSTGSGQRPLSLRHRAILELLYSSGLRLGEILRLKVEDVDLTRGLAFIERGKGNKDRMVPVGSAAASAIQEYLTCLRPTLLRPNPPFDKLRTADVPHLFVTRKGEMMKAQVVHNTLHKYARAAGVAKRVYPHLLRHTMATHLLKGGAPLAIVSGILGHVQPSTTQLYTHLDKRDLSRAWIRYHPRGRWLFENEAHPLPNPPPFLHNAGGQARGREIMVS